MTSEQATKVDIFPTPEWDGPSLGLMYPTLVISM